MASFRVSSSALGEVEVDASNWLVALGEGLGRLGVVASLSRIACEVLPNGTILVRDVQRGHGYIVQPLGIPLPESRDETEETTHQSAAPDPTTAESLPEQTMSWVNAIQGAGDKRMAVRRALQGAMALIPCEGGSVLLEQKDGTLLFAVSAGPEAARLRNVTLPGSTGIAGFCVDHAVALTVKDAYADERFYQGVDTLTGSHTRSILCVPVAIEHRVFGCIELINATGGQGFAPRALAEASLLGDTLGERLGRG